MKLLLLTLISSVCFSGAFAQSAPNGGMENWQTEMFIIQQPVSWGTMNLLGLTSGGIFPVTKVTDAHSGNFAAKIQTVNVEYEGTEILLPGLMQLGTIDVLNQELASGQPFSSRPDSVIFWYKYAPEGQDQGVISGALTYYDETIGQKIPIAAFQYLVLEEQPTWKRHSVALAYVSQETPDSLSMVFTSSAIQPVEGTALWIDDISFFTNAELSVAEKPELKFSVYPNPAKEAITITTAAETTLGIYNVLGSRLQSVRSEPSGTTKISVSELPNGVYLLKTTGGHTQRFVVRH